MQTENTYVETDLGNIALNPRGEYSKDTTYEYLDTVSYRGGSYMCLVDLGDSVTGIEPTEGKNTKYWQLVAIPGDITERYTKMYEDVVTKSGQVEASRAAVSESQQDVETAQADVSQMRQDTQEASEEAIASRDSAAGYAQSAETSRTAAKESEDNVNALATTFDSHVNEKISEAEKEINNTKQNAVDAVSESLNAAVTKIENGTNKQVKSVENAGASQVSAVNKAGKSRVDEISTAGSTVIDAVEIQQEKSVQAVIDEGTKQIKAVSDKATEQISAVNKVGSTQISTIESKGSEQVKAVQNAGENALQNISNGVDKGLSEEGKAADAKATGEAISKLTEDTAVLQKRQNVLVGSETGNPVRCDDAFAAPLCGLNVYGNSTQDGTPSPNNPVPIVSAGDGGIVVVRVTGKNLIQPYTKNTRLSKNGATMDYDVATQLVHIYGTTTGLADLYSDLQQIPFHVKSAVTMSLVEVSGNIPAGVTVQYSDFTTLGLSCTASKPYDTGAFDRSNAPGFLRFTVNIPEGLTFDCLFKVQLELGVTATTYEPYHEQTLTLSTPNGLPGIPVTSGGNYTDQNGQQWVCDKVDLERGVNVQRVDKTAFDSTKTLAEQNAILTTPIETPLTPAEIAAYKALTAYGPDTVVQAGDGAGVRLDYQRDVNIAIKRIEDAVASMT